MMPLVWMLAVGLGAWALATLLSPVAINPAALAGVGGPLLSAALTWVVVARTHAAAPERVTRVMIVGFAVKAVFFAGYVVALLSGAGLDARVFVVSFVTSFLVFHVMEAFSLKKLFAGGGLAAPVPGR